jgi:hypothetical protein
VGRAPAQEVGPADADPSPPAAAAVDIARAIADGDLDRGAAVRDALQRRALADDWLRAFVDRPRGTPPRPPANTSRPDSPGRSPGSRSS